MVVEANGIPLGMVAAPADRGDSPLLTPTLEAVEVSTELPEQVSLYLDRAHDSNIIRGLLADHGPACVVSEEGKPAPLGLKKVGFVERTDSWSKAHDNKKLVWRTGRKGRVIDLWIAFSNGPPRGLTQRLSFVLRQFNYVLLLDEGSR